MPLISHTSSAFGYLSGGAMGEAFIKYPANTLIAYDGNDPNIPGWTRYSQADGNYLSSTVTPSRIGTVTAASGGTLSDTRTTGTTGSHTAGTIRQWISTVSGSSNIWNASAGAHNHGFSVSSSLLTPENMLSRQTITFLRATEATDTIPANALVFKETAPTFGAEPYGASNTRYLKGALDNITYNAGVPQSRIINTFTSSAGAHSHAGSTRATRFPLITGGFFNNYDVEFVGNHTHPVTISVSQSQVASKLFKLWKYVVASMPTTDTIVMYVGTLGTLPRPWYLCNGLNGTVNIGEALIGYNTTNWGAQTFDNISGSATVGTVNATHRHDFSLRGTATNITGPLGQHNSFSWSHNHTSSLTGMAGYAPPKINVAFIQYKG